MEMSNLDQSSKFIFDRYFGHKMFVWIKKIKSALFWKGDGFFGKSEDGREIYYPWGLPGEAFYVDQRQSKLIIILHYFMAFLILVSFVMSEFLPTIGIDTFMGQILWAMVNLVLLWVAVIYILSMHILKIKADLFSPSTKNSLPKKWILFWALLIVLSFFLWAPLSISSFLVLPILLQAITCVGLFLTIYVVYVLMRIRSTKGYYFSEKK